MNKDPLLTDAEKRTTITHPANMKFDKLQEFRQAAYKHLGKAHDATFELTDAILATRNANSLADLCKGFPTSFVKEFTQRTVTHMQSKRLEIVRQRVGRVPRLVATAEPVRARLSRSLFELPLKSIQGMPLNFSPFLSPMTWSTRYSGSLLGI